MSDSENVAPEVPIIGTLGIILSTAYRAVNIDSIAIVFVLGALLSMLTIFLVHLFVLLCKKLHSE